MKRKDKGRLVDIEMMLTPNLTEPETDPAPESTQGPASTFCLRLF